MRRLFLGIDVSTTGAKALLIDEKGGVAASATTPLTLQTPKPLWSEQDPHEWWKGTSASIRKALAEAGASGADVAAVGLTGQMHGLVLLDAKDEVLRPAILWNDQRTAAECAEIETRVGRAALVREVGNVALTGFTAPKILWVRNHEPEVFKKAKRVLLPKDYVRLRLTGDSPALEAPWGLAGAQAMGTLLAFPAPDIDLDSLRQLQRPEVRSAITRVDGVVVCRALAAQSEPIRQLFAELWLQLRPALLGRAAVAPRIWAT